MDRFLKLMYFFCITAIVLFVYSCANIGSITGGDKDTICPVMVSSVPLLNDTNFKGDKIEIRFDEYFDLKDINTEFLSSPPFMEKPDFKIKKKSVISKHSGRPQVKLLLPEMIL